MATGRISWTDLTVADATSIRDFYSAVVGWRSEDVDMGGYTDFGMVPSGEADAVAGICHARGQNAEIPPVWLVYISVENLVASLDEATKLGATVIDGPRMAEEGVGFAVIRDPAGAVCALYQEAPGR